MRARSASTCSGRPRDFPSASGLKGPYVTPLTKNFLSPSKKNFAAGRIRESLVVVMSREVETSLDVWGDSIKRFLAFARNDKREPLARSKILSAFSGKHELFPLQDRQHFANYRGCALEILRQVRRGDKPGFKLRWREVDFAT